MADALPRPLASIGILATGKLGIISRTSARSERVRTGVDAAGLGIVGFVIRVPDVAHRCRGRGGGRARELAEALPGRLARVGGLATRELGVKSGASVDGERVRTGVGATSRNPIGLVVRIPDVPHCRGGRSGRRARELAEALPGRLARVGTLAASELRVEGRTSARSERVRPGVGATSLGPLRFVVRIPDSAIRRRW